MPRFEDGCFGGLFGLGDPLNGDPIISIGLAPVADD